MSERLPAGTVISANLASLIHLTSATTERSLATPYLKLMKVAAQQRGYLIREMFNALPYVIRYGIAWRAMPNDFSLWAAV